jgi:hypothetical protein
MRMTRSKAAFIVLALLLGAAGDSSQRAAHAAGWIGLSDAIVADVAAIAPPLVTRDEWQAKPALPGLKPHRPVGIIIHHTAVRQNPKIPVEKKMRGLQAFSQRPGQVTKSLRKPAWPDVPYHFYVAVSGRIAEGRDVRYAGDTNTNYDPAGYIQVVVEGEFGKENPSAEQLAALRKLLAALMVAWNFPVKALGTHRDHASTDCPGRNFTAVWPRLRADAAEERRAAIAARCAGGASADFARLYCRGR